MSTLLTSLVFIGAAAWCAERLVRGRRALDAVWPLAPLIMSWVLLMTMRTPTPLRALFAFALADVAVFALSVLAVLRLLGAFEDAAADDDDWRDDGTDEPPIQPPSPPGGTHPDLPRGVPRRPKPVGPAARPPRHARRPRRTTSSPLS